MSETEPLAGRRRGKRDEARGEWRRVGFVARAGIPCLGTGNGRWSPARRAPALRTPSLAFLPSLTFIVPFGAGGRRAAYK